VAAIYESAVVLNGEGAEVLIDAVARFAASKGWRVRDRTDHMVVCLVPVNMFSWGEEVRVVAEPHSIRVISRCRFPFQVIDCGKNARNVEEVRDCLLRAMRAGA